MASNRQIILRLIAKVKQAVAANAED